MINEVSPPGWGHTKAEKEKTKPEKPKSKIGGTAHAMKLAQKRGDIPKNMNIFALMWSMKNKGDKPHYKPGVKDKLKGKYKGPEGQNEMIDPKKIRNYKNVSNAVVAKADKEAQKVKDKEQKGTLEFPQMPTEESTEQDEMIQKVVEYIKTNGAQRKTAGGDGRRKGNHKDVEEATAGELELANAKKSDKKQQGGSLKHKVWPASASEGTEGDALVKAVAKSPKQQALKKKQMLSITSAGKKALKKGDQKLSITAKGLAAVKEGEDVEVDETLDLKKIRAQRRDKAAGRMKDVKKVFSKKTKPTTDRRVVPRHDASVRGSDRGYFEEVTPFGDVLRQAIEEAKKVNAIDTINKIVKTKTMGKIHNQQVDLFTASAIQQVYKAINHKNKEKMNVIMSKDVHGLLKMADFSMKQMKR